MVATNELQAIVDPKLAKDAGHVGRHGTASNTEGVCDSLVFVARDEQVENLALSACERSTRGDGARGLNLVAQAHGDLGAEQNETRFVDRRALDPRSVDERTVGGVEIDHGNAVVHSPNELGVAARQASPLEAKAAGRCASDDDRTPFDADARATPRMADRRDTARLGNTGVHGPIRSRSVSTRHQDSFGPCRHERQGLDLARGDEVDRYVVLELLGQGGSGAVFRAFDPDLDRAVALKLLWETGEVEARKWLLREGQALARVVHPNVVAVHDVGIWHDRVYLAMELLEGSTLSTWATECRPRFTDVLHAFEDAANGLQAIHNAGLVHRDIKPTNMVMSRSGRLVFVDFGLARRDDGGRVGSPLDHLPSGTPHYFAPELQAGGRADRCTDLYALCLSFVELIDDSNIAAPPWFTALLRRGLVHAPSGRPPSVESLLRDVQRRARRRTWVKRSSAGAVIASAILASVAMPKVVEEPTSEVAAREVEDRRAALREATDLSAVLADWEPAAVNGLTDRMDAFERAWEATYLDLLERRRDVGDTRSGVTANCLERAWARYAAVVGFGASSPKYHADLTPAVAGIADPSFCRNDTDPQVDLPRPVSSAQQDSVEVLRQRIDAVVAQLDFVPPAPVLAGLDALAPDVEDTAFDALSAEFQTQRAFGLLQVGDFERAADQAQSAILMAAKCGHLLAVVRGTKTLGIALSELRRYEIADAWVARALADAEANEGLAVERAQLLRVASLIARRQGALDRAHDSLTTAMALLADPDPEVLSELAQVLVEQRDMEGALDVAYEVAAQFEVEVGWDAANALAANVNLGRIALRFNRNHLASDILLPIVETYRSQAPTQYGALARILLAAARRANGALDDAAHLLDEAAVTLDALDAPTDLLRDKIAREREAL